MTFGPVGRISISIVSVALLGAGVLAIGPWSPFALWFAFGWSMVVSFVLRDVWQPTRVAKDARELGYRRWLREDSLLATDLEPWAPLFRMATLGAGAVALIMIYSHSGVPGRFAIFVLATLAAMNWLLIRLSGS